MKELNESVQNYKLRIVEFNDEINTSQEQLIFSISTKKMMGHIKMMLE